jgi:hypothetical protein
MASFYSNSKFFIRHLGFDFNDMALQQSGFQSVELLNDVGRRLKVINELFVLTRFSLKFSVG